MKLSILCEGVIKPPALGCGKLGQDNIEKGVLGVSMECLFRSNGDHILVPRFDASCLAIMFQTQRNSQFFAKESSNLLLSVAASSVGAI
jgi:hypothetical protein